MSGGAAGPGPAAAPTTPADAAAAGMPLRAWLLMAVFALTWTVAEALAATTLREITVYQVVWGRYVAHLLIMSVVLGRRRGLDLLRTRQVGLQISRSLLMLGMPVLWVAALRWIGPRTAMSVFWLAPLIVVALAAVLLRERVGPLHWLAAAGGAAGVLLMFRPTAEIVRTDAGGAAGAILALAAATCFAAYIVATRMLRHEATSTNLFYSALFVFLPVSLVMPFVWRPPTLQTVVLLAATGAVGLVCLWAIDRACGAAPVTSLAPLIFAQPASQLGGELLARGRMPDPLMVGGMLAVAISACIALMATRRTARPRRVCPAPARKL